ncbi:hypothetical protein D3C73_1108740 [compost metagenome]
MLSSTVLDPRCGKIESIFNTDIPIQKEGLELYKKAQQIYLDPSKPYVDVFHPEHLPQLPKDIETISANITKPVEDMWVKGILGGAKYTPEQAKTEAQATWNKGDGKKVEDWFKNWYANDKDKSFLATDMYEIMKKQMK